MLNTVLIIEDDLHFAKSLSRLMRSTGFHAEAAQSGEDGLARLDELQPDLVLIDIVLPGMDGIEVTRKIRESNPGAVCIIITGKASVETAVDAMRAGAFDFISKISNMQEIQFRIQKALEMSTLMRQVSCLRRETSEPSEIIGESRAMRTLRQKVQEIAQTPSSSVLIIGETGSGKELVARAVHRLSERKDQPLVTVNCAAVPANLLESEFFGHERGAFTGADRLKKGLFEMAHGGSLFLDEIGELELMLQAKLLRALEDRRFKRVGGTRDISVDLRIIAATNQHLEKMVGQGGFREDLYYRLNVFPIHLPPIREREDDVLLLALHFIREFNQQFRKQVQGLDSLVEQSLKSYAFPGNVRQLRNFIEQAMIMARGSRLTLELFPALANALPSGTQDTLSRPALPPANLPLAGQLEAVRMSQQELLQAEYAIIQRAVSESKGNKTKAAKLLGLSRYSLRRRLQRLEAGIQDEAPAEAH